MTPAETTAILRQFNERCRDCQFDDPHRVMEAIDAAVEMIERMEKRLRLILEEPENTMSNGKAMREMLRQARLALGKPK